MENYKTVRVLGEGAYGIVSKCVDKRTGMVVAVKEHFDFYKYRVSTAVKKEYQMLRQMEHYNVVTVLDHFQDYGVFEIADHTVYDDVKWRIWGLYRGMLRKYTYQLLQGVNYIHSKNIIHLDLKLDNLLVTRSGVLKVADFGLAKAVVSRHPCSTRCAVGHSAPELLLDETSYGKPVDVWAIGICILCMAKGFYYIKGETDKEQLEEIVSKIGPLTEQQLRTFHRHYGRRALHRLPPTQAHKNLQKKYGLRDPLLADLVDKCLQVDPCKRATCAELLEHSYFTHDGFNTKFLNKIQQMIQKDRAYNKPVARKIKTTPTTNIGRWEVPAKEGKSVVNVAFMRAFKAIRRCFFRSPTVACQPNSVQHEEQPIVEVELSEAEVVPFVTEVEPFVTEVVPFVTEVEPCLTEVVPFVTEVEPFVTEVEPFVTEVEPFVTEVEPFVTEVEPNKDVVESSEDVVKSSKDVQSSEDVVKSSKDVQSSEDVVKSSKDVQSSEDVVKSSEDVQSSEDVVKSSEDVQSSDDVDKSSEDVQSSDDVVKSSEDVQSSKDVVESSEDVVESSEDVVESSEDVVESSDDVVDPTEVVQRIVAHAQKLKAEVKQLKAVLKRPSAEAGSIQALVEELTHVARDIKVLTFSRHPRAPSLNKHKKDRKRGVFQRAMKAVRRFFRCR